MRLFVVVFLGVRRLALPFCTQSPFKPAQKKERAPRPTPPNPDQQIDPENRAQTKKQQAGPRTGAGAGRRTLLSEYLGAGAVMAGRVSYCLSMLLSAATSFCSSIAYCRNFFALLRFDWQIQACAWISFRLQEGVFDIELRERASPHCAFCFSSFSQFQLPLQSAVIQLFLQLLLVAVQAIFQLPRTHTTF